MAASATAQPAPDRRAPLGRQVSAASGRIQGLVRDDVGQSIGGVNILALGTILAAATTDTHGRFALTLPPGEYVLRATRDGYVSTYREPVRVQTSIALERTITLVRQAPLDRPLDAGTIPVLATGDDHAHSEAAWLLRHLPRTVLRDEGAAPGESASADDDRFTPAGSLLGRAVNGSARAATAFFSGTEFSGQVNLLTTSALGTADGWLPQQWSRGIASVAVGAPVGSAGDWVVRGAVSPGDASSWTLLGEYASHREQTHAFTVGVSYSTQAFLTSRTPPMTLGAALARSAGSAYGSDRWRVLPGVALEYGARLDRFDYVADQTRLSPQLGLDVDVFSRLRLRADARDRSIAPGAEEFLPPATAGPWLPPERTFSSLVPGVPLRAERVRHVEAGADYVVTRDRTLAVGVRRFAETTANQIATVFGVDAASNVGHYYVASPGSVDVEGWLVRIDGVLAPHVRGQIEYAAADADWVGARAGTGLRWFAPSAARKGAERVHDLTTNLSAFVPVTATRLTFVYRFNTLFSRSRETGRAPAADGRFDLEVRQELPYQPTHGSRLEIVIAARTLLGDPRTGGSFYDELLTVAPPMRLMGGLQVRF